MSISVVTGYMQSGKTKKTFSVLSDMMKEKYGRTLVLFVTQFNNSTVEDQTYQRLCNAENILEHFEVENILKCDELKEKEFENKNAIITGFWHSRNTKKMILAVKENNWHNIIMIFDEADQGDVAGFKSRMKFVDNVKKVSYAVIDLIFITATIANLSNEAYKFITKNEKYDYVHNKLFFNTMFNSNVNLYFAEPPQNYLNPQFLSEKSWIEIEYEQDNKDEVIFKTVKRLEDQQKKLVLYVSSVVKDDHDLFGKSLLDDAGFDVCIKVNSMICSKYEVMYKDKDGEFTNYVLPYKMIKKYADLGMFVPAIKNSTEYTLSHLLYCAIYDRDSIECDGIEKEKLESLFDFFDAIKPDDFPKNPKVAIIAGHVASRGISIQNQQINFVCTACVFAESSGSSQLGAINAQRVGRACGLLMDYINKNNMIPILITTKKAMKETKGSIAVIDYVLQKGSCSLPALISKKEYKDIIDRIE